MFRSVGAKYSPSFTQDLDWYKSYTWSVREEKRFKIWLVKEIQKEFRLNKRAAANDADFFLLNYGWTYKIEEC